MEAKTEVHLLANLQGPMQEPCWYSTAILSLSDQLSVPIPWLLHSSFPMGLACHPLRRDNQGLRKILHPDSKLEGVIQSVREWESKSHPWVTHSNGCSMSLRRLGILCTSVRAQIAVSVLLKLNCYSRVFCMSIPKSRLNSKTNIGWITVCSELSIIILRKW